MLKQNIWKPSTYRDHQDVKGVFLAVILALCHFMAGGGDQTRCQEDICVCL
jgi:hypothetical protein